MVSTSTFTSWAENAINDRGQIDNLIKWMGVYPKPGKVISQDGNYCGMCIASGYKHADEYVTI